MELISRYITDAFRSTVAGWNRFWFTPRDPATLGLIRFATGLMFLYANIVWLVDWQGFFGQDGWLNAAARELRWQNYEPTMQSVMRDFYWSHFNWILNSTALLVIHYGVIFVGFCLTLGLFSRVVAPLAWFFTISYAHRNPFATFGLDSILMMLTMYLMLGPCGDAFSIDRWWKKKKLRRADEESVSDKRVKNERPTVEQGSTAIHPDASVGANVAIRLIQLHMCLIYLFSAFGKLQGEFWNDGFAIWLSAANLEYQSSDMTGIASNPILGSFITHLTVIWELSYSALIWPRLWRPVVLALAIPLHLGIGLFMGMMTFGLIMLVGNFAFVEPWIVRSILAKRR